MNYFRANANFYVLRIVMSGSCPDVNQLRQMVLSSAMPVVGWNVKDSGECQPLTLTPLTPNENEISGILLPNNAVVSDAKLHRSVDEFVQVIADRWLASRAAARAA